MLHPVGSVMPAGARHESSDPSKTEETIFLLVQASMAVSIICLSQFEGSNGFEARGQWQSERSRDVTKSLVSTNLESKEFACRVN